MSALGSVSAIGALTLVKERVNTALLVYFSQPGNSGISFDLFLQKKVPRLVEREERSLRA